MVAAAALSAVVVAVGVVSGVVAKASSAVAVVAIGLPVAGIAVAAAVVGAAPVVAVFCCLLGSIGSNTSLDGTCKVLVVSTSRAAIALSIAFTATIVSRRAVAATMAIRRLAVNSDATPASAVGVNIGAMVAISEFSLFSYRRGPTRRITKTFGGRLSF